MLRSCALGVLKSNALARTALGSIVPSAQSRNMGHKVNIVLLEDVQNLGSKGEEISARAGHVRNFLYPQKLAVYATEENRQRHKTSGEEASEEVIGFKKLIESVTRKLKSYPVVFKRQALSQNHLKSEVNAEMIQDALEQQLGLKIALECIKLPAASFKTIGEHRIKLVIDNTPEMIALGYEEKVSIPAKVSIRKR